MPTLSPGLNFVPRCLTRMVPPVTTCPAKRFTTSLLDWLSRPFLELPTPFLLAISRYCPFRNAPADLFPRATCPLSLWRSLQYGPRSNPVDAPGCAGIAFFFCILVRGPYHLCRWPLQRLGPRPLAPRVGQYSSGLR